MYTETSEYQQARIAALPSDRLEHRVSWQRWRNVSDRVISHRDYRYNGQPQRKAVLLNLAQFAMQMMAVHNTATWRGL